MPLWECSHSVWTFASCLYWGTWRPRWTSCPYSLILGMVIPCQSMPILSRVLEWQEHVHLERERPCLRLGHLSVLTLRLLASWSGPGWPGMQSCTCVYPLTLARVSGTLLVEQCCKRLHFNGNTLVWGQTGLVLNDKNGSLPGGQLQLLCLHCKLLEHSSNVISSHLSYLISWGHNCWWWL